MSLVPNIFKDLTKKTICLVVGIVFFTIFVSSIELGDSIRRNSEHKIDFLVRSILNPPELNQKIKIFNYDDKTVARLNRFDLTLTEWATVFAQLSLKKPAGIYVDKLFDSPTYSESQIDSFKTIMQKVTTPVYPISFISEHKIKYRKKLDTAVLVDQSKIIIDRNTDKIGHLYGPNPKIIKDFRSTGHAVYEGANYVSIIKKIDSDKWLPHWSIWASSKFSHICALLIMWVAVIVPSHAQAITMHAELQAV